MTTPPSPAVEFGQIIKRLRASRGWSAAELARRARVIAGRDGSRLKLSQQSISYVEKGHQKRVPEWARYVERVLRDAILSGEAPIEITAELTPEEQNSPEWEAILAEKMNSGETVRLDPAEELNLYERLRSITLKADRALLTELSNERLHSIHSVASGKRARTHKDRSDFSLFEVQYAPGATGSRESSVAYLPVRVLPAFAGMGGEGLPDSDHETALVPRRLIEDDLRGRPEHFMLINVRGDSMEPDFRHGDQLLVDLRDRLPIQPGPFAVRFEQGYVVKNIERTRDGLRMFSSNNKYSDEHINTDDMDFEILGRPVWFGRRL